MSLLVIVTSHRCPFLLVMEGHFIFTSEIGLFVSKLLSQSKDNGGSIQSPRLTSPVISYCCNQQKQWRDFFSAGKIRGIIPYQPQYQKYPESPDEEAELMTNNGQVRINTKYINLRIKSNTFNMW